jgi:hypothetical protein
MNWRIVILLVVGMLVLGGVITGLTNLAAQPAYPRMPVDMVGRYVVVTSNPIIIMDTTTGDLYHARGSDIKEFSERPRLRAPEPPDFGEKDKGYPRFKDKDSFPRFKDKDKKLDSKDFEGFKKKDQIPSQPPLAAWRFGTQGAKQQSASQ